MSLNENQRVVCFVPTSIAVAGFASIGKVNRHTIFFYLAVAVVGRRSRSSKT